MPAMAAPLAADKLSAWEAWAGELNGPRKAGFDDMNARHGLTEHRAYLQANPDGTYAVLVTIEGPGAETFLPNMMQSDHEFDQWFGSSVAHLHDFDTTAPMPPLAPRRI